MCEKFKTRKTLKIVKCEKSRKAVKVRKTRKVGKSPCFSVVSIEQRLRKSGFQTLQGVLHKKFDISHISHISHIRKFNREIRFLVFMASFRTCA